ncbi:unnamed protein product [Sphagnum jensenii]|uniref:Uncharacterized protein n=1 Tax=Sphagnum jensenii TaxID=128206 RepID=A0ABP0W2A6_9BRYO
MAMRSLCLEASEKYDGDGRLLPHYVLGSLRDLVLEKMWDCSATRRLESFDLAEIVGNENREMYQSIKFWWFIIGQEKTGAGNLVQMLCSVYV